MSLLGYDNNDKTLSGDVDVYATNVYATNIYDNNVDVGATLITLQAEIDALEGQIISSGTTGYYGLFGSSNNASNPLAEKSFYFNQTIATNGFSITGGTGLSATRITAANAAVYNIYYKANYQKIDATTAYEVRTWLMKNGVDVDYSTTLNTLSTTAQWQQISGQFTVSLAANDYLEIKWLSANAAASSDILDSVASASPYPQVAAMFACIQQVANTDTGLDAVFVVASTNTLPAGSSATVVDTTTTFPTYVNHSLVFGIPQGLQGVNGTNGTNGATGATGPQGPKGDKGNKGDDGPQGPAGDGPIAYAALSLAGVAEATAIAAAAAAASAISQNTVQDGIIAANTADIATDEGRITLLEVATTGQTYGALTGTTFARRVNITNTGAGVGATAVYLGSSEASTFLYGLSASNAISTTSTITSTAGTSQMSSLLVNNNMEITNDAFITAGEMYITRTLLNNQKKLVLYDNATGNDYDYLGFWTMDGATGRKFFNAEIDGNANSAFQWYYGDGVGLSRTLMKSMNQTLETSFIPTSKFLKSPGFTQEIALVKDSPNSRVRIDMIGDTGLIGSYDGQIIQEEGNGVNDNTGIMTIQSGSLTLNALTPATGEIEMNTVILDINTTGAITMDTTTTTTLTSGAGTSINCTTFDLNATGETNISVDDAINISATSIAGTITISTATNEIILNSGNSIDTTSTDFTITTSGASVDLTLSNPTIDAFELNCPNTQFIFSSAGIMTMNMNELDINSTDLITIDGTSMTLTTTGETEINSTIFDLNASSTINMDGTAMTLNATTGNMTWTTSTTGDFNITSGRNINFITNETNGITNLTSNKDQDIFRVYNSDAFDSKFLVGSSTQGFRTTVNNNSYANLNGLGQTQVNLSTNNAQINLTAGGASGKLTLTSSLSEVEINSVALDMNATGAITMDTTTTTTLTSGGTTRIDCVALDMNATGAITMDTTTTTTLTSGGTTTIDCVALDINATGAITMDTDDPITITSTANGIALSSFGEQDITCGSLDINSNGTITIDSVSNNTITSAGNLNLVSTTNDVDIQGIVKINTTTTKATSIGNTTGTLALTGSTNTILGTTNINRTGTSATSIGNTGALTLNGSTYNCTTTGNQTFTATSGDFALVGSDVVITTTGTGAGEFVVRANTNVDIKANTGNLELNANTTMLIKSDGTNTLQVDGANKMITSPTTTDITNDTINLDGDTNVVVDFTFNMMPTATIIQNLSATVPPGFLYCNGGNISRTTYSKLFTAIGTAFGAGDGSTTFGKPNLMGAYLRGTSNQTVGGITYTGPAIGTAQQDSVLEAYNEGYWNVDAGGGGSNRAVRSRVQLTGDPEDTGGNSTTKFLRQNATENRVFNYSVYYYIRY